MSCSYHPALPAVAYCRICGRGLCAQDQQLFNGVVYCPEHVRAVYEGFTQSGLGGEEYAPPPPGNPGAAYTPPYPPPPPRATPVETSPALAFLLGFIPGVGAIYNGQYLKGFVHVAILGVLISLISNGGETGGRAAPFLGLLIGTWVLYMPFEAYHTARKRQQGMPFDEWSSLLQRNRRGRLPLGPIILIALGVVFLLDSLHVLYFHDVGRFWPLILIVVGAYSLYSRLSCSSTSPLPRPPQTFYEPPPPPPPPPVNTPLTASEVRHE